MANLQLPFGVRVLNGLPVEDKYLNDGKPYTNTSQVNTLLPIGLRYTGLTVNINGSEYWYATGITNSSLVTKSLGGGGTITANNGLTKSPSGNIHLGGNLTGSTDISGAQDFSFGLGSAGLNSFYVFSEGDVYLQRFTPTLDTNVSLTSTGFAITSNDTANSSNGGLQYFSATNQLSLSTGGNNDAETSLIASNGIQQVSISAGLSSGALRIFDTRTVATGIEYAANYAANYTDRSLVDKGWVLSVVTGGTGSTSITANNGITKTGDNIYLGGAITGNTSLDPDTNQMYNLRLGETNGFYAISSSSLNTDFNSIDPNDVNRFSTIFGRGDESGFLQSGFGVTDFTNFLGSSVVAQSNSTSAIVQIISQHSVGLSGTSLVISSENGATKFIDTRTITSGIEYNSDYSAGYTNRSLVDRGFVNDFYVPRTVPSLETVTIDFSQGSFNLTGIDAQLYGFSDGTNSYLRLGGTDGVQQLVIDPSGLYSPGGGLKFYDSRSSGFAVGVEYGDDYSAGYTNRSLVDKGWVLSQITGGTGSTSSVTANNGLTKSPSGNIHLGGILTGNTTINLGTNSLTIVGDNANASYFTLGGLNSGFVAENYTYPQGMSIGNYSGDTTIIHQDPNADFLIGSNSYVEIRSTNADGDFSSIFTTGTTILLNSEKGPVHINSSGFTLSTIDTTSGSEGLNIHSLELGSINIQANVNNGLGGEIRLQDDGTVNIFNNNKGGSLRFINGETSIDASSGVTIVNNGGGNILGYGLQIRSTESDVQIITNNTGNILLAASTQVSFPNTGLSGEIELKDDGFVHIRNRDIINGDTTVVLSGQTGLVYGGDYSANFGPRSIPDVEWVLANAGGTGSTSITANNGLTAINGNVYLGGTLTGDTSILGSGYTLSLLTSGTTIRSAGNGVLLEDTLGSYVGLSTYLGDVAGTLYVNPDIISITTGYNDMDGTHKSEIVLEDGAISLIVQDDPEAVSLLLRSEQYSRVRTNYYFGIGTSSPSIPFSGATYEQDFSANFGPRSIPDVEWVLNNAAGGAENGLSKQGNNTVLGGLLTGDTVINGANIYSLRFGTTGGDEMNSFSVVGNLSSLNLNQNAFSAYGGDSNTGPNGYIGLYDTSFELGVVNNGTAQIGILGNNSSNQFNIFVSNFSNINHAFTMSPTVVNGYYNDGTNNGQFMAGGGASVLDHNNGGTNIYTSIVAGNSDTVALTYQDNNTSYNNAITIGSSGILLNIGDANGEIDLNSQDAGMLLSASANSVENGIRLQSQYNGDSNVVTIKSTLFEINTTAGSFAGITYGNDYSTNYTNRSLVDKEYAVGLVTPEISLGAGTIIPVKLLYLQLVDTSTGPALCTLTNTPNDRQIIKIKDRNGNAATNNITIDGNGINIDGSATAVINTNYGMIEMLYSSVMNEWFILGQVN